MGYVISCGGYKFHVDFEKRAIVKIERGEKPRKPFRAGRYIIVRISIDPQWNLNRCLEYVLECLFFSRLVSCFLVYFFV